MQATSLSLISLLSIGLMVAQSVQFGTHPCIVHADQKLHQAHGDFATNSPVRIDNEEEINEIKTAMSIAIKELLECYSVIKREHTAVHGRINHFRKDNTKINICNNYGEMITFIPTDSKGGPCIVIFTTNLHFRQDGRTDSEIIGGSPNGIHSLSYGNDGRSGLDIRGPYSNINCNSHYTDVFGLPKQYSGPKNGRFDRPGAVQFGSDSADFRQGHEHFTYCEHHDHRSQDYHQGNHRPQHDPPHNYYHGELCPHYPDGRHGESNRHYDYHQENDHNDCERGAHSRPYNCNHGGLVPQHHHGDCQGEHKRQFDYHQGCDRHHSGHRQGAYLHENRMGCPGQHLYNYGCVSPFAQNKNFPVKHEGSRNGVQGSDVGLPSTVDNQKSGNVPSSGNRYLKDVNNGPTDGNYLENTNLSPKGVKNTDSVRTGGGELDNTKPSSETIEQMC